MKRVHGVLLLALLTAAFAAACATLQSRWEEARQADTIAAYEDFLREFPEGDWAEQARMRRNELSEERDWKVAESRNTIAGYEDFMKHHPHGRHKDDVFARLEKLSTESFLKRYHQGLFMEEALATLERLSFEKAATDNTISAFEDFLQRYPTGRLADEIRQRMEQLYFEQAHAEGTIPAYGGYLKRYPDGVFAVAARIEQEKLKPILPEAEWGTIMYPRQNTNIRSKRSTASPRRGQLKNGQPVKADFLQDAWYAVFPVTQKERDEKLALGYVYAPLLIEKRKPDVSGSAAPEQISTPDSPLKSRETESRSVEVKNITFKAAGDGKEWLFIEFDRFCTPAISGINGQNPRIILEIKNASSLRDDLAAIDAGTLFIRQILSSRDPQNRTVRIVLDMVPGKDYFVNQAFYIKENIYSLEISEKK